MIIALEGIDGSGKATQSHLLESRLRETGFSVELLSFPRYGMTLFANLIRDYLNGKVGEQSTVSPEACAVMFAGDRLESRDEITRILHEKDILICDRYTASNIVYQAAKVNPDVREEFIEWLAKLEFETFGLPQPDIVVYLRVPTSVALRLKSGSVDTPLELDIHERDVEYLNKCNQIYESLAAREYCGRWLAFNCVGDQGEMLAEMDIMEHIWKEIAPLLA